jgi:hypothetical protein
MTTQPASIKFRISNGNHLILHFPEREVCNMFTETARKAVRTLSAFRAQYDCDVAFVPVLGPVEHNRHLFQMEARATGPHYSPRIQEVQKHLAPLSREIR